MPYNYEADRQASLTKMRSATEARQRYLDMIYARMEAEEAQRAAEEQSAQAADNKNWLDEGAQGAMIGGGVGGPWGALVGAIAGTAMGQKKAYDQRRKEGQGGFDAFTRTIFDTPFGSNKLNAGNMTNAASAYGSSKRSYETDKALKEPSRPPSQPAPQGGTYQSAGPGRLNPSYPNQKLGGINEQQNTGFDTSARPAQVQFVQPTANYSDPRLTDRRSDPFYDDYRRR